MIDHSVCGRHIVAAFHTWGYSAIREEVLRLTEHRLRRRLSLHKVAGLQCSSQLHDRLADIRVARFSCIFHLYGIIRRQR